MSQSVQPEWMKELPLQQQSVLFLAARGPDGIEKFHPVKEIQRAYRATVFVAAKHGKRMLKYGETGDSFMSLAAFADIGTWWSDCIDNFINHIDSLPLHYVMHLMHGAQILGYKHPDERFSYKWFKLYLALVKNFHLNVETEQEMDERLKD